MTLPAKWPPDLYDIARQVNSHIEHWDVVAIPGDGYIRLVAGIGGALKVADMYTDEADAILVMECKRLTRRERMYRAGLKFSLLLSAAALAFASM